MFFLKTFLSQKLISEPENIEENLFHPKSIIKLIMSYKILVELGVTYETLKRHGEYQKLSEAEAYFLMEHLADARKNKSKVNEFAIVEAFEKTAKLIGLSYPGGNEIEQQALKGNEDKFVLPKQLVNDKATTAVSENDFPVMTGSVLLFAVFYTVIIFLSDLTYGLVDPRIRYS